jgi:plasmid stabilization system protein ParE
MKLDFAKSALSDLQEIKSHYAGLGVAHIGKGFVQDILFKVQVLLQHPEIGRMVPEFEQPALRELIHKPFRIIYLRQENQINIIRIWRSERLLKEMNLPPDL